MSGAGRRWDADRGLPSREIELRAYGNGHYHGRFMLRPRPGAKRDQRARLVAVVLADLVGATLASSALSLG